MGTKKKGVNKMVDKLVNCPFCDGTGLDADDEDEGKRGIRKCPQCKGKAGLSKGQQRYYGIKEEVE